MILWLNCVAATPVDVTIEGEVVCLDSLREDTALLPDACKEGKGRFALRTNSGQNYLFLPEDPRAEIFRDSRLWSRTLRITGRVRAPQTIEIMSLRAIREGRLYDVYYHCDVCNIKTFADGPCPCCQEPVEYRETPAEVQ